MAAITHFSWHGQTAFEPCSTSREKSSQSQANVLIQSCLVIKDAQGPFSPAEKDPTEQFLCCYLEHSLARAPSFLLRVIYHCSSHQCISCFFSVLFLTLASLSPFLSVCSISRHQRQLNCLLPPLAFFQSHNCSDGELHVRSTAILHSSHAQSLRLISVLEKAICISRAGWLEVD